MDIAATRLDASGDAGVPHGEALLAYADAALMGDAERVIATRDALVAALGADETVDAAAVIAMFQLNTRAADASGAPVERLEGQQKIGDVLGLTYSR